MYFQTLEAVVHPDCVNSIQVFRFCSLTLLYIMWEIASPRRDHSRGLHHEGISIPWLHLHGNQIWILFRLILGLWNYSGTEFGYLGM